MHCFQNKKSAVKSFLVMVLLITAGFVVIFMIVPLILSSSNRAYADSICKGSIAFRDMTYTEIKTPGPGPVPSFKLAAFGTPRLCKTSEFDLPEDKDAKPEDVKKLMAELMASCWDRYGEGLIQDVFKGGVTGQKCQVCYNINLRQTSKFKDEIPYTDFLQYLFNTPYKISSESDSCKGLEDGFCIDSEKKEDCGGKFSDSVDSSYVEIDKGNSACKRKGHSSCCYTDYGCWNKGGRCSASNPNKDQYTQYDDEQWDCPSGLKCFIENKNYYSYGQYVQRFAGEGVVMVTTNIMPGRTYSISFGSPTENCGWCGYAKMGGAIAGAIGGGTLAAIGVAAAPFTLGTSLTLTVVGVGVLAGTVGGTVALAVTSEAINAGIDKLFRERKYNTVYLTTLDQIQEEKLCDIIQ